MPKKKPAKTSSRSKASKPKAKSVLKREAAQQGRGWRDPSVHGPEPADQVKLDEFFESLDDDTPSYRNDLREELDEEIHDIIFDIEAELNSLSNYVEDRFGRLKEKLSRI